MFDKEAIQELAQAQAITAAQEAVDAAFDGEGIAALPSDFMVHDLEKHLPHRRRARGMLTTSSVPDFAAYVAAHAEAGASAFVDQDRMQAVAVLNLGAPTAPGHADNRAAMAPKKTAAYTALLAHATGQHLLQAKAAEFFEDWPGEFEFFSDDAGTNGESTPGKISPPKAIAAVRKITIEAAAKVESQVKQLGTSKSAFESVQASSSVPMPTTIYFKCAPFHGLSERIFVLRLGVHAGTEKTPAVGISLRIVNAEKHAEEMAAELAQLVRDALQSIPVLVGTYNAAA